MRVLWHAISNVFYIVLPELRDQPNSRAIQSDKLDFLIEMKITFDLLKITFPFKTLKNTINVPLKKIKKKSFFKKSNQPFNHNLQYRFLSSHKYHLHVLHLSLIIQSLLSVNLSSHTFTIAFLYKKSFVYNCFLFRTVLIL